MNGLFYFTHVIYSGICSVSFASCFLIFIFGVLCVGFIGCTAEFVQFLGPLGATNLSVVFTSESKVPDIFHTVVWEPTFYCSKE